MRGVTPDDLAGVQRGATHLRRELVHVLGAHACGEHCLSGRHTCRHEKALCYHGDSRGARLSPPMLGDISVNDACRHKEEPAERRGARMPWVKAIRDVRRRRPYGGGTQGSGRDGRSEDAEQGAELRSVVEWRGGVEEEHAHDGPVGWLCRAAKVIPHPRRLEASHTDQILDAAARAAEHVALLARAAKPRRLTRRGNGVDDGQRQHGASPGESIEDSGAFGRIRLEEGRLHRPVAAMKDGRVVDRLEFQYVAHEAHHGLQHHRRRRRRWRDSGERGEAVTRSEAVAEAPFLLGQPHAAILREGRRAGCRQPPVEAQIVRQATPVLHTATGVAQLATERHRIFAAPSPIPSRTHQRLRLRLAETRLAAA
mmetsp:Transcript_16788/g.46519  ORF Transcript_16788/g.46519 Transcript_16788/m.46519 type:complete len:369 (+) Transcript_16788:2141-3247(+)